MIIDWLLNNYIEIFGAVAGIVYVILEIRQNIWLWPVGIITSVVYIWVFFTGKLYADMSLQGYYLVISVIGWYWWGRRQIQPAVEGKTGAGSPVSPLEGGEGGVRQIHPPDPPTPLTLRGTSLQRGNSQGETEGRRDEETKRQRDEETKGRSDVETEGLVVSRIKLKTGIIIFIVFVIIYSAMWFVLDRFTDSPVPEWDSFITSLSIIATWMLARKIYEHWYLWIIINIAAALLFYTRALYPTVILYLVYMVMSFAGLKEWKKSLTELPARGSDRISEA